MDRDATVELRVKPILTVGAGNTETLIGVRSVALGQKHVVPATMTSVGGSAVNHACRLLAAGHEALPLVPLGDDRFGDTIKETVLAAAEKGGLTAKKVGTLTTWLDTITQPGESTAQTTILVEDGGRRTIFSEMSTVSVGFADVCRSALDMLGSTPLSAVIIGHIHADAVSGEATVGDQGGGITSTVIERFRGKAPIVANLGRSQYRLGSERWAKELRHVHLLQLAYAEAAEFTGSTPDAPEGLVAMARWFQEQGINAVITVDKFGAVGVSRGSEEAVVAWPLDLDDRIVDTTGAGDALAAGLAAALSAQGESRDFNLDRLKVCMEAAHPWAAYACTRMGGAQDCPSNQELRAFASEVTPFRPMEKLPLRDKSSLLWLLDRAFRG